MTFFSDSYQKRPTYEQVAASESLFNSSQRVSAYTMGEAYCDRSSADVGYRPRNIDSELFFLAVDCIRTKEQGTEEEFNKALAAFEAKLDSRHADYLQSSAEASRKTLTLLAGIVSLFVVAGLLGECNRSEQHRNTNNRSEQITLIRNA